MISTNPGSMEAGVYGLTRGMCLVALRLEMVAVAGLLRISWCVLGGVDFNLFLFFSIFFFERTRLTASMRPPCLIYLFTSTGVRTGCHFVISLSVCVRVCDDEFVVFTDCEGCTRPISTNTVSM